MSIEKSTDINYDCDSYPRALKEYFTRLQEDPTHYAYYLDIPVQIPPEDVIEDFATLDLLATCASGPYANLPSIAFWIEYYLSDEEGSLDELQVEMNVEINAFIDDLALTYPIVGSSIETDRKAYNNGSVGKSEKRSSTSNLGLTFLPFLRPSRQQVLIPVNRKSRKHIP